MVRGSIDASTEAKRDSRQGLRMIGAAGGGAGANRDLRRGLGIEPALLETMFPFTDSAGAGANRDLRRGLGIDLALLETLLPFTDSGRHGKQSRIRFKTMGVLRSFPADPQLGHESEEPLPVHELHE